jgi:hypothetical protein
VIQLIDDQLLGAVLRGDDPPQRRGAVFTTGYWYVRLCQAVLGAAGRAGALSGPFTALPATVRQRALQTLLELPATIGLVSLRELAPLIGHLRRRHALNALGMEALAASVLLEATVYLSAPSPLLEQALALEGRTAQRIG